MTRGSKGFFRLNVPGVRSDLSLVYQILVASPSAENTFFLTVCLPSYLAYSSWSPNWIRLKTEWPMQVATLGWKQIAILAYTWPWSIFYCNSHLSGTCEIKFLDPIGRVWVLLPAGWLSYSPFHVWHFDHIGALSPGFDVPAGYRYSGMCFSSYKKINNTALVQHDLGLGTCSRREWGHPGFPKSALHPHGSV